MTKLVEQLNQAKREITLSSDRKREIRTAILASIGQNKVQTKSSGAFFSFHFSRFVVAPLALAVVLFAGAGVTYAAQDSLPGDKLYNLKLNFNEKVKTNFSLSAEKKAEAQLGLFEDRLDEAVKLSSDDRLDDAKTTYVQSLFDKYEAAAQARIDLLNAAGKTEAAEMLEARLHALIATHERVLAKMEKKNNLALQTVLKVKSEESAKRSETENHESKPDQFKQAAQNKINAAATVLTQTDEYIAKLESRAEENSKTRSQAKLDEAQKSLDQARAQLEDSKYAESFASANASIRLAQEAKTLLRLDSQFQIRVNFSSEGDVKGAEDKNEQKTEKQERKPEDTGSKERGLLNLPLRWPR
jgi:hypothetical protein